MAKQRIDVHQHVLPPFWVEGLKARKSVHRPPAWTPEAAIAYMDSRQIAKGILSLTAPGLANWAADERRDMARQVNAYTASLATQWPGRFGNFATLPLPDLEGALLEIAHALDTLGADGVVLLSNYEGRYLGDTCFDPVWAELDRREATVLIHPTRLAMPELEGIPGPFVDFPFDTTRTAVDMVMKGVFQRHGKVRVILSHAGGFLPYAAQRFASCAATMPGQSDEQALMGLSLWPWQGGRKVHGDAGCEHSAFARRACSDCQRERRSTLRQHARLNLGGGIAIPPAKQNIAPATFPTQLTLGLRDRNYMQ
jgi:6-methylsalicylate decarboxylase